MKEISRRLRELRGLTTTKLADIAADLDAYVYAGANARVYLTTAILEAEFGREAVEQWAIAYRIRKHNGRMQ
jgi:hypothetical protein